MKIADNIRLLLAFYKAAYLQVTKSPINLWLTTLLQIVYYIAQFLFWFGVVSTNSGNQFIGGKNLAAFLVTLAAVDNYYLFFLGPGSINLERRIMNRNLEPILFWPRSHLMVFVFSTPNIAQSINALLATCGLLWFYSKYDIGFFGIVIHVTTIISGMFLLNGISFLYRMTIFWTASVVQIRNSNPSFKIIVRPLEAFQKYLRWALLTVFPALYVTAIPSEILSGSMPKAFVGLCCLASGVIWVYVACVWKMGLARYEVKEN